MHNICLEGELDALKALMFSLLYSMHLCQGIKPQKSDLCMCTALAHRSLIGMQGKKGVAMAREQGLNFTV